MKACSQWAPNEDGTRCVWCPAPKGAHQTGECPDCGGWAFVWVQSSPVTEVRVPCERCNPAGNRHHGVLDRAGRPAGPIARPREDSRDLVRRMLRKRGIDPDSDPVIVAETERLNREAGL